MHTAHSIREQRVLVISRNVETVETLTRYLAGAGLPAKGSDSVEALVADEARRGLKGCVLFPEDFPNDAVDAEISALHRRTTPTLVLVTSKPKRFADRVDVGGNLVVLAKPAWAWSILDAINGRLDDSSGGPTR